MSDDRPGRCVVEATADGTRAYSPCGALERVLSHGASSSAGAHLQSFINFRSGKVTERLVIQPLKKQGKGIIANFCPMCGTPISEAAAGFGQFIPSDISGCSGELA